MIRFFPAREARQGLGRGESLLDAKRGSDGLISAEDAATYDRMEAEVVNSARRSNGWSARLPSTGN